MLRHTGKFICGSLLALAVIVAGSHPALADLTAVGPVNLQNGFPIWFQDQNLTQIEICLDPANCLIGLPPVAGNPYSQQIGFGAEAFYWAASADLGGGLGLFELAMEAAFGGGDPALGGQLPFVRLRVRANVQQPGTYTINYPFGTLTINNVTVADGINFTIDVAGAGADTPPFAGALATGVPPFTPAAFDQGTPPLQNGASVFFSGVSPVPTPGFMGVPGIPSVIDPTGLVNGATVTITGPAGAFGAVNSISNNDLWDVAGKLFFPGVNLAPIANPDFAGTQVGTPVTINVVANDTDPIAAGTNDHGINPLAVALGSNTVNLIANAIGAGSSIPTTQNGTATLNANGTITYTPPPTFAGVDTFSYLVQDTGGLVDTAVVTVTVEQFVGSQATLQRKFLKWDIAGTSTVIQLSGTDGLGNTFYNTPLSGALNTPPRPTSTGSGSAFVTVLTDAGGAVTGLDFTLQVNGLTGITAAHIHAAPAAGFLGEIAPIAVTLFDADGNIGSVAGPTAVDSPLTTTPLTRFPAGDGRNTDTVTNVDDPVGGPLPNLQAVVDAILAGRAYVQIHTLANLPGEIRGQLGRNTVALRSGGAAGPVIGAAAVTGTGINGTWSFSGKSKANPGAPGTNVHATSAAGNVITFPLVLR